MSPALPPALVALSLTLPGLDSHDARRVLDASLGGQARVLLTSTDRGHGCFTLRLTVPHEVVPDVIGVVIARFQEATIGRLIPAPLPTPR